MKKFLFYIVSVVMMVFASSAMTSCSEEEQGLRMAVRAGIYYYNNVSPETEEGLNLAATQINQRLVQMFGETFYVKCDEAGNIDDGTKKSFMNRIYDDKEIGSIIDRIALVKDLDGDPAVKWVRFEFISGTSTKWEFDIPLEHK